MDRIGVRELRQHASRHLARVARGEMLEITDRGRPVARLVPVTTDAWADMITSGKVTPAEDQTDVADEVPGDYDVDASAVLAALRAGER
ncbi:type II toxin-antitoxin system Phd/YefM family antitoxin [soil metagenome]